MLYDLSKLSNNIKSQIENSVELTALFNKKPDEMLAFDTNAKTVKGQKQGYLTAILYLAPHVSSGVNVCPMAFKAQCDVSCLFTAGRGAMDSVFFSRLRKTLYWTQYKDEAIMLIKKDIARAEKYAKKRDLILTVRLNGTSDICFENYDIIQSFPNVQFYDYTKRPNRKNLPSNYDLTFSYSGVNSFAPYVKQALANGMRLAVVFRDRQTVETMLANGVKFLGLDIYDGDESDLRFLEPKGIISALYAKGKARRDGTGFVVDIPEQFKLAA